MFERLITRQSLLDFADDSTFKRGEDYYRAGLVERLRADGNKMSARVRGSENYHVGFQHENGRLLSECSCPRAADGYFCKHSVAVGLAWLDKQTETGQPVKTDPWASIHGYLAFQPTETLIEWLLTACERDDALYNSLLLKAELASGGEIGKTLRNAIQRATQLNGFVDWHEAGSVADELAEILDSLNELLTPEHASLLIELTEYGIERIDAALQQIDDSNGEVGGVMESLDQLHLKACAMAQPDPLALAERLFELEMNNEMGICDFTPATYAAILGEAGLRRYRQRVQAEFDQLSPTQSRDRFDSRRLRIVRLMESMAKADGDIELLIDIKALDLTHAYNYLAIAEILANAGQLDRALDWAERGLAAFPLRTDARLRDFLAAAYLRSQRKDEALQMIWLQFEETPSLTTYQKLHQFAQQLGNWPQQRQRALDRLAANASRQPQKNSLLSRFQGQTVASLVLEIALWEKDLDAAWTAANQDECQADLLIRLADQLASNQRGEDACQIYRRLIPRFVEQTNNSAYQQAANLLVKMQSLLKAGPNAGDFGSYVAELRAQFKAKRNFIKLLERFR